MRAWFHPRISDVAEPVLIFEKANLTDASAIYGMALGANVRMLLIVTFETSQFVGVSDK